MNRTCPFPHHVSPVRRVPLLMRADLPDFCTFCFVLVMFAGYVALVWRS